MASDRPIGFGILGSGNMARVYGDALSTQTTNGRLVAIALGSRTPALSAEFGVAAEPSAEALLARSDVDVVIIATPHSTHLPLAEQTAAAGKHVYLEKPMALNTAECDRIIAACEKAGVLLTVAKQTRHGDPEMLARKLISEGAIGDIRYLRPMSPIAGLGIAPGNHWSEDPREGDGFLDWGSHCCDAIRWFTGSEAIRAYADYENFSGLPVAGPTAAVQFRLASKAIAQILMIYEVVPPGLGSNSNNQYLIVGSEATLEFDLDTLRIGRNGAWETLLELPTWINPLQPRNPRRIKRSALQVQDFIDAIREGRAPAIGGWDGRQAIQMAQAASLSAATGQAVNLPLGH